MNRTQEWRPAGSGAVAVRRARAGDLAVLGDFFAGLSARSRYLRFFAPIAPTPAMLRVLCGGGTTDAVVATCSGAIVGHAMAADRIDPGGSGTTEIGVVVADAWQRQGVGSALVRALIAGARARGLTSLAMDVLPGNEPVLAMIRSHWPAAHVGHSADCLTVRVRLPEQRQESRIACGALAPLTPFRRRVKINGSHLEPVP